MHNSLAALQRRVVFERRACTATLACNSPNDPCKYRLICDRIPTTNQTFIADSFNGLTPADGGSSPNQGIALALGPSAPAFGDNITYLTGIADAPDRGEFFATPTLPSPNLCNVSTNPNGLVVVAVTRSAGPTAMPSATGAGTPANSYGYVRFRARIN